MTQQPQLMDDAGGHGGVERLVLDFYARMLRDDQLAPYFADTSVIQQQQRLAHAFVLVLGGRQRRYGDVTHLRERLREAHQPLGITNEHYERMTQHLGDACTALEVPEVVVRVVVEVLAAVRDDVVGQV